MRHKQPTEERVIGALDEAVHEWIGGGHTQSLTRWLQDELDARGEPIRLPISKWFYCADSLMSATRKLTHGPEPWREPVARLAQATVYFSRQDGSPVTHFDPVEKDRVRVLASFERAVATTQAEQNGKPRGNGGVGSGQVNGTPSALTSALRVLRPGWPDTYEFLAIDHRQPGTNCRLELFAAGRSWLGPNWAVGTDELPASARPKAPAMTTDCSESLAEWSYRAGDSRVTQSVLFQPEVKLALLSMIVEWQSPLAPKLTVSLARPPSVAATAIAGSRAILLTTPTKPGTAQVLPIGLPSLDYPSDRGSFRIHDGSLVLSHSIGGRRAWLPLLVSWDSRRHRKELSWRVLSVSEQSRNVPPDQAFAARVSWGRNETFVIYRSLAPPQPRAFLGHHTTARFLVGRFTPEGNVEPIFKID